MTALARRRAVFVTLAVVCAAAGAFGATRASKALYDYSWTHPVVMLTGQALLLALVAATSRGAVSGMAAQASFWLFTGATAGPLFFRASDELAGSLAACLVSFGAIATAVLLFNTLRSRAEPAVEDGRGSHKSIVDNG